MISYLLLLGMSAAFFRPSGPEPLEILSWFSPDSYPEEALRAKAEGTVTFEVHVDARGKPSGCVVTESSGHASLDSGTCDVIRRQGLFRPPTGPDGKPVASTYVSKVSWKIPVSAPHSYRAVILDITHGEAARRCRVEAMEMLPDEAVSCASALHYVTQRPDVAKSFKRVTFLLMYSDKDISPFPPDPSWGQRLSRLVSEQTRLGDSSYPIACTTVLAEGFSKGADACAGLPTRRLTAAETAIAQTGRMEMSIFGVPRD